MAKFAVGETVWFTAPHNVNQLDHGLVPGQEVKAVVSEVNIEGPEWYTVDYDEGMQIDGLITLQRQISAHESELEERW